jgi:hyperosmotically inducible periplasmic protein
MRTIKSLVAVGISVVAIAGLTSCATWHKDSDRTAGRIKDDNRLTKQVKTELDREPAYKFNNVSVQTFAGVVQLSGFVNTEEQKQRAVQIAQNTPGVLQVINSIAMKPPPPPSLAGSNPAPTYSASTIPK